MSQKFIKNIEDFVCEQCGFAVEGDGYTNHCPKCLWSKHVDEFPGDRKSTCGGMMKPLKLEVEKGDFILTNECVKCSYSKRNKTRSEDDLSILLGDKKTNK